MSSISLASSRVARSPSPRPPALAWRHGNEVSHGNVWVRRWRMPKTRNHVYYTIEGTEIVVLTIWGAPRGHGPKL